MMTVAPRDEDEPANDYPQPMTRNTESENESNANDAPIEMYVAVQAYQLTDDEYEYDPTLRVFTYPFADEEKAEREAEGMRDACRSDDGPEMDWWHVDVQRILVPLDRDYEQMDEGTHEKLQRAAGAVAEGLVTEEMGDER